MKQSRWISRIFGISTVLLLCAMCSVVAYQYRSITCDTLHGGGSAPAEIAFLYAIPFIIGAGISFVLYLQYRKKG